MSIQDIADEAERRAENREYLYDDAQSYRGGVREGILAVMQLLDLSERRAVQYSIAAHQ